MFYFELQVAAIWDLIWRIGNLQARSKGSVLLVSSSGKIGGYHQLVGQKSYPTFRQYHPLHYLMAMFKLDGRLHSIFIPHISKIVEQKPWWAELHPGILTCWTHKWWFGRWCSFQLGDSCYEVPYEFCGADCTPFNFHCLQIIGVLSMKEI